MPARTEEEIILKLVLRGEQEADILDYLKRHGMLDPLSVERVQSKIIEAKAALSYQPIHPPRKRIRAYGITLIIIGLGVVGFFAGTSIYPSGRYNPGGYALWLVVIGIILVIWPDKGVDKL